MNKNDLKGWENALNEQVQLSREYLEQIQKLRKTIDRQIKQIAKYKKQLQK